MDRNDGSDDLFQKRLFMAGMLFCTVFMLLYDSPDSGSEEKCDHGTGEWTDPGFCTDPGTCTAVPAL